MRLSGGPGRPAAPAPAPRSPSPRPGRLRPRKWPLAYDDTKPHSTRRLRPASGPAAPPRAAPLPTLPRFSRSATPRHFLSSFKGRGSRLTSHPSAECFLGLVVYRWSRSSPSFPDCFVLIPSRPGALLISVYPYSLSSSLLLILGSAAPQISFWALQSSLLLLSTCLSLSASPT